MEIWSLFDCIPVSVFCYITSVIVDKIHPSVYHTAHHVITLLQPDWVVSTARKSLHSRLKNYIVTGLIGALGEL